MIDKELNLYHAFLFEDPIATDALIEKHTDRLIRLTYLYTKDSSAAEELVEDAFATLFVNQKVFEHNSEFKIYLYQVLFKKCVKYARRHRKATPPEDIEEVLQTPFFARIIERNVQFQDLYVGMAQLPPHYAGLLYLAYFDNFPVEEICEITRKSKTEVYNRLEKGKVALKTLLKRLRKQRLQEEQETQTEQDGHTAQEAQTEQEGQEEITAQDPPTALENLDGQERPEVQEIQNSQEDQEHHEEQ